MSLSLEIALSTLQRSDGAKETRTLLPGIDLSHLFAGGEHAAVSQQQEHGGGGEGEPVGGGCEYDVDRCLGLPVLQTPKDVGLREAMWEAATASLLQQHLRPQSRSSSSRESDGGAPSSSKPRPPPSAAPIELTTPIVHQSLPQAHPPPPPVTSTTTQEARHTPWEALLSNLQEQQQQQQQVVPSTRYTPPPLETASRRPPALNVDVSMLSPAIAIPSSIAMAGITPGAPTLLSPGGLLLTPGAPDSVPLELRAAAAERLWPLLAPFAPRMLRDDILLPPDQRRFVVAKSSTSSGGPTLPALQPTLPSPSLQSPMQAPWVTSSWHLDSEMLPQGTPLQAAVAMADISGFTALTEILSRSLTTGGVELLTRCMNSYFAQVIDLVLSHGGDIAKFAGDAMVIVFLPTQQEQEEDGDGGLGCATRRAAAAVKELVDTYGVMGMHASGEAVPIPRNEVIRSGSRFVWLAGQQQQQQASDSLSDTDSQSLGLTPRFMSAAASPFKKVAHAGQSIARKSGGKIAKALVSPWAGVKSLAVGSGGGDQGVWLDWMGSSSDGSSSDDHDDDEDERVVESRWQWGRRRRRRQQQQRGSNNERRVHSAPSSPRKLDVTRSTGDDEPASSASATTSRGGGAEDGRAMDDVLRSIHERDLAAMVAEFTGGGSMLKIRPPELPRRGGKDDNDNDDGEGDGDGGSDKKHALNARRTVSFATASTYTQHDSTETNKSRSFPFNTTSMRRPSDVRRLVTNAFSRKDTTNEVNEVVEEGYNKNKKRDSIATRLGNIATTLPPLPFLPRRQRMGATASAPSSPPDSPHRHLNTTETSALSSTMTATTSSPLSFTFPRATSFFTASRGGGAMNTTGASASNNSYTSILDRKYSSSSHVSNAQPSSSPTVTLDPSQYLLSLKVTLAAGAICAYRVGGVMEPTAAGCPEAARWEFFIADADNDDNNKIRKAGPISQLTATEKFAIPGHVVMSNEASSLIQGYAELVSLPSGTATRLASISPRYYEEQKQHFLPRFGKIKEELNRLSQMSPQDSVTAYQILRSHVPFNVRVRVEAGHIDSVNEIRMCTVVFLAFPSLTRLSSSSSPAETLEAVQAATQIAQGRMHQDGGFFLQMRCDEKGYIALCAFGLPGRAHEDIPARGILAALAVVQALERQGQSAVAGVTTGNLFCGVVGSSRRAEYTVYGDAINLAARLMMEAQRSVLSSSSTSSSSSTATTRVLCDESTRWMASGRAEFSPLEALLVKGKAKPLQSYLVTAIEGWTEAGLPEGVPSPVLPRFLAAQIEHERGLSVGRASGTATTAATTTATTTTATTDEGAMKDEDAPHQRMDSLLLDNDNRVPLDMVVPPGIDLKLLAPRTALAPLIGRDAELALTGKRVTALIEGRGGGAIFMEGDAGLGKTRLAEEIAWGPGMAPLRERCVVLASAGRAMRQSEPLNPWRRIFRHAFAADVRLSAEKRARDTTRIGASSATTTTSCSVENDQFSDLAIRLSERLPEYAVWRPVIASALGMPEEELPPVVPPRHCHGATPLLSRSKEAREVAVDDVTVLLMARAHTFHEGYPSLMVEGQQPSNYRHSLDCGGEVAAVGGGEGVGGMSQTTIPSATVSSPPGRPQRSVSACNLDPGRPVSISAPPPLASDNSLGAPGSVVEGEDDPRGQLPPLPSPYAGPPPQEMSVPLRALKVRGLLIALLREFAACHGQILLIFDDLHLFDSPSWRMVLAVLSCLKREVLLVGTLRPVLPLSLPLLLHLPSQHPPPTSPLGLLASRERDPAPPTTPLPAKPAGVKNYDAFFRQLGEYYEEALSKPGSEKIVLQRFTLDQVQRFFTSALGGVDVPPAAAHLLWDKSAGMPAYVQQMALFLKLRAQWAVVNGDGGGGGGTTGSGSHQDVLTLVRSGLNFIRATVNVHSIVPSRVDQLRPDEQVTLKAASVMGSTIYVDLLLASHPKPPSRRRLEGQLRLLRTEGFIKREEGSDSTWVFVDVLVRDVVYDMIPLTQRKEWHARLAAAMVVKSRQGDDVDVEGDEKKKKKEKKTKSIPAAIVAYHFTQACFQDEIAHWQVALHAIEWWERAAGEAAQKGAFTEESSLLHNAAIISSALSPLRRDVGHIDVYSMPLIAPWRESRWERCAAAALLAAGVHGAVQPAIAGCLRGLAVMGNVPMPWDGVYTKYVKSGSGKKNKKKKKDGSIMAPSSPSSASAAWNRAIKTFAAKVVGSGGRKDSSEAESLAANDEGPEGGGVEGGDTARTAQLVNAVLNRDFATMAQIEPDNDDEWGEEWEMLAVVSVMAAATLELPPAAGDAVVSYVLWVVEQLDVRQLDSVIEELEECIKRSDRSKWGREQGAVVMASLKQIVMDGEDDDGDDNDLIVDT